MSLKPIWGAYQDLLVVPFLAIQEWMISAVSHGEGPIAGYFSHSILTDPWAFACFFLAITLALKCNFWSPAWHTLSHLPQGMILRRILPRGFWLHPPSSTCEHGLPKLYSVVHLSDLILTYYLQSNDIMQNADTLFSKFHLAILICTLY